jgi:mono/diheme cytochrome c family protein
VNWPAVRLGMDPYAKHCEKCHGLFGETNEAALDLAEAARQKRLDDAAIRAVITRIMVGCPASGGGHGGSRARAARVRADAVARVHPLLPLLCAVPRDDGHPPGTLAETFRRPQVVFDAAYFAHTSKDELETAIWHMLDDKTQRMPQFARVLDEDEAAAIVEFLRADRHGKER